MATDITLDHSNVYGDAESEIAAAVVGTGTLLVQAAAVIPGLLPCLLLLLPFVLPPLILGAVVGLLIALPVGIWRLTALAGRGLRRRLARLGARPRLVGGQSHLAGN